MHITHSQIHQIYGIIPELWDTTAKQVWIRDNNKNYLLEVGADDEDVNQLNFASNLEHVQEKNLLYHRLIHGNLYVSV